MVFGQSKDENQDPLLFRRCQPSSNSICSHSSFGVLLHSRGLTIWHWIRFISSGVGYLKNIYYRTIKPYNFSRSASSLFCTLRDLFTGHRTYMSHGHAFMVFLNSLSETLRVQGDVWGCAKLRFTFETIIPLVTFQIPLRAQNIVFLYRNAIGLATGWLPAEIYIHPGVILQI